MVQLKEKIFMKKTAKKNDNVSLQHYAARAFYSAYSKIQKPSGQLEELKSKSY